MFCKDNNTYTRIQMPLKSKNAANDPQKLKGRNKKKKNKNWKPEFKMMTLVVSQREQIIYRGEKN